MTAILRNVPKTFTFEEQRIEINEIALDLYNLKLGTLELTDFSVVKPNPAPAGGGDVTYDNTTGEFTYTPPLFTVYSVEALLSPGIQLLNDGNAQASNRIFFDGLNGITIARKTGTTNTIEFSGDPDWNNAVSWGDHKLEGYLKSNGTYWDTNTNAYESSTLDLIGNVSLTNIQNDEYLKWNGTAWVNTTFPSIPAAQIQSDWDQTTTSALDYIKNKPTLVENLNDLGDVDTTGLTGGKILVAQSNNTWVIGDQTDYDEFTGTDAGLVPASTAGETDKYLKSNGLWEIPANDNTTYQLDSSNDGLNDVKLTLIGNDSSTDSVVITKGTNITFTNVTTSGFTINSTATGGGSGTVTSIATGTGLTGGPITTSGTISLDATIGQLSNVEVTGANAPADGQVLKWVSSANAWRPATDLTAGGGGITNITDLNDVAYTGLPNGGSPALNSIFQWNGSNWTNAAPSWPTEIAELDDVSNTPPNDGEVLSWDDSNSIWIPTALSGGGVDNYVDTATLTGTNLVLGRTGSLADLTVNLSSLSGGGGGGANVTISDTEPSSPSTGDLWWASNQGQLKIYYDDGVGNPSSQWVDTGGTGGGTAGTDSYVTNATLTGTDLVLTRSGGLSNITTDLSSLGGSGGSTYTLAALLSPGVELLEDGVAIPANRIFFDAGDGITVTRTNTNPHTIEFAGTTFSGTTVGLVPASTSGVTDKFLRSDGTWQTVSSGATSGNTYVTYLNGQPRWSLQTAANSYSESISYQTASNTGPGGIDLTPLCDGNNGTYVSMGVGHANISYLWLSQAWLTDVIKVTIGYDGDGWVGFSGTGNNPANLPVEGGGTYTSGISGSPTELVLWDSSSPAYSGQLQNISFTSYDDPNGSAPFGVIKGATSVCHVYYFKITRSVDNVLTEITYTAPGSGGGTTQDLQDVTDEGKTTTNDIIAAGFTSNGDVIIDYDSSASNSSGDIKFKDGSGVKLTISSKFESINSGTNWINRIKSDTVGSPLVITGGKGAYNNSGAATVIGFSGGLMPDIPHLIGLDDDYNYLTELYGGGTKVFTTQVDGVQPIGALYDKDDEKGTAGQILSSTGTALDWIDPPTGGNGIVTANVKDFGAVGDDSTDDTTAIQNAINSLVGGAVGKGGIVYLPPGIYRISAPLTFGSNAYSVTLKGSSTHYPVGNFGGSVIRNTGVVTTDPNNPSIQLTSGNAIEITNSLSIAITNLGIDHTSSSGGTAIKATSTNSRQGVTIDQVYILKHSKGIDLTGYANSIIRNSEIREQPDNADSTHAILLKKGSDTRQDQLRMENVIVEGLVDGSTRHQYSKGLLVEDWTNSLWIKDCCFLRCKYGIYFDQSMGGETSDAAAFHRIENCDVDQNDADGVFIDGGYAIWLQNCYLSSNINSGLVTGENFKGTMWINSPDCRGNNMFGMAFNVNHNKIQINSPHIADNGSAQPAQSAGIQVLDGANDISIMGGFIGGNVFGQHVNSSNQQIGIRFVGSSHNRININGVDVTHNIAGGIEWQLAGQNTSSTGMNFIQNCAGYSTGQTTFP